ncbi:MAG: ATP-binding cassette domain-containing protein [Alphaproteobacteria bacterium]|nr:ATP-binding cassette domain-containing protein [Alphaproteobacteria bacterium]
MIEVEHLSKRFGAIQAVDDVSFRVERGEVLGFLGPNGAGKSTTMKVITGFLEADSGTARLDGYDIRTHPIEAKRNLGYMPEGAPSYHEMTPLSFLRFIAGIRGFSGDEAEARVGTAAEQTQLGSVLYQPIDTLSRGYKRRVGLAQALLHDPDILILDEPTDGLDPNQKHEVRTLIQEMAADKAIVISTHILEEVDAVCSRAIIIAHGRIVADGTPDALEARSPRHMGVAITASPETCTQLAGDIGGLDGVANVETEQGGLFVTPKDGKDILDPVRVLVRQRGLSVADIRLERGRLEDVFREVTTGAGRGGGR